MPDITINQSDPVEVITISVPGIQGPPARITVNNVVTGQPGTSAAASSVQNAAGENVVSFTIPRGDVGPANTLTIGTVTTGAVGANAAATLTGTAPNQTLNLTLPRGAQGTQGIQGIQGPQGPANSLTIGTVSNGTASASLTGTAPNQVLNLTLPQGIQGVQGLQGVKGDTGPQGPQGIQGPAGTGITISGSATTYANLPTNLTAADAGDGYIVNADGKLYIWDGTKFPANGSGSAFQGPAGPANTLSVSSTTTGAVGTNATVTVSGTAPNQTLAFTIPRGATGATGPANSLTIGTVTAGAAGSTPTASITGTAPSQVLNLTIPAGATGAAGAAGAAGAKGDTGSTGPAGPANVLSIGTITTGNPGTPAGATITGTAPNQVLNLTIPQGQQGPTGAGNTDATTTAKGSVQLAGHLGGTAAAPTVISGAGHTHTASQVSDATTVGRSVLTATDAAAARTAIGAGTSNLVIGTTSSTAMAGNKTFTYTDVGAAPASHTHDDRYYTETEANAKFIQTINNVGPDANGNVVVSTTGTSTGGTGTGTSPVNYITIEQYNANAGSGSDDNTAMQSAWAALGPGVVLKLRDGKTYRHSAVLDDQGRSGYTIEGNATILATNANTSAIFVRGDNVTLKDFTKDKTPGTTRIDAYQAHNIVCDGALNLTIKKVRSRRGTGTGFFLTRLDGFRLENLIVEDTLADGIHMTGGSKNGKVIDPRVWWAGDDGVSVVSYVGGSDGGMCDSIDVINPVVIGSKAGRGVTCVGGTNVRFYNITVEDTFAAGVYVANESYGSNPILGVTNILVSGGTIRKANRNTDPNGVANPVDHGAILVSSQRTGVTNSNVIIENLTVMDTRKVAPWEVAVMSSGGTNDGIILRGMVFINPAAGSSGTNPVNYFSGWNGGVNSNIKFYGWQTIKETDGQVGGAGGGSTNFSGVEGIVIFDTSWPASRPSGYARVRYVGGTTRPTTMVTGDVWEHAV